MALDRSHYVAAGSVYCFCSGLVAMMFSACDKNICNVDIRLNKRSEKQSCGFNISGLDCPDWFGKIWAGNVSLNSLSQIYASVLRCCGIYEQGKGRNKGYMETTRIVIEQLGLLCVCSYIFPLLVVFVDRKDYMEQVRKMLNNPPFQLK